MNRTIGHMLVFGFAATSAGSAVSAGETPHSRKPLPVVELFTSQGCSSCPPADALFASYAQRRDVVALSFPVDYWDYLGWKDTLASPKFTARQRDYAAQRGDGEVYTPQVVVDGTVRAVGSNAAAVEKAVETSAARCANSPVSLSVAADTKSYDLAIDSRSPGQPDGMVWVVVIKPTVSVTVARGENRGRMLTYHNVVRDIVPVGRWENGHARFSVEKASLPATGDERSAVLVQQGKGGPIVAAGWLE